MEHCVKKVMIVPDHSPLIGIADESLAQSLAREVELFATAGRVTIVSTLMEVRLHASRAAPQVIFLDSDLLEGAPLAESLDYFRTIAPVDSCSRLSIGNGDRAVRGRRRR